MPVNLSGRNFLKLLDFTSDEIRYLIDLSKQFKQLKLTFHLIAKMDGL